MTEAGDGGEQEGEHQEQQQQEEQEESRHEGHRTDDYQEGCATTRAFGALTFEEEKHLMIAKAHLAVAADCRRQHLASEKATSNEVEKASARFDQLLEDLRQEIGLVASHEAICDQKAMKAVALVPKLWDDRAFTMKVLKAGGSGIYMGCSLLRPEIRDDKEMLLTAVVSNPRAMYYASDALRTDRKIWLAALHSKRARETHIAMSLGSSFGTQFLGDKELMVAAVASDPCSLAIATAEIQGDRDVVLAALRAQTPEHVAYSGINMLAHAGGLFLDDGEVMLEAARSGAAVLQDASLSLRMDKAFMLRTTRCVPPKEQKEAYNQAHESIWRNFAWENWKGAARSALAITGDSAPILTLRLLPPTQPTHQQGKSTSTSAPRSCEVTLLSGASFTCELPANFAEADPDCGDDDDDNDDDDPDDEDSEEEGESDEEGEEEESEEEEESVDSEDADDAGLQPAPKRQKVESPIAAEEGKTEKEGQKDGQSLPGATVAQLARVVLKELHRQVEMDPSPRTIFLAFLAENGDGESTVATAWDWNRPVDEFL